MQHVDEGRLNEWLDRDRSGMTAAEAAELELHLASCTECRALLEVETALRERAAGILTKAGPAIVVTPDFEALRDRHAVSEIGRRSTRWSSTRRTLIPLAWAASFIGAIGLGWLTRDLLLEDRSTLEVATISSEAGDLALPPAAPAPSVLVPESQAGPEVRSTAGGTAARSPTDATREAERPLVAPSSGAGSGGGTSGAVAAGAAAAIALAEQAAPPPAAVASAPPDASGAGGGPGTDIPAAPPAAALAPRRVVGFAPAAANLDAPTVARGRILTQAGQPVPSAQVVLQGTSVATVTGSEGEFALAIPESQVASGQPVVLAALRIGFDQSTLAFAPAPGDTIDAELRMRESVLALEAITVTGAGDRVSAAPADAALDTSQSPAPPAAPPPPAPSAAPLPEGTWVPVSRAAAERALGTPLLALPGREVIRAEMLTLVGGRPVIRFVQPLEDGGELTLRISRGQVAPLEPTLPTGASVLTERRGDLFLTASGNLAVAELARLLRMVED